MTTSRTYRALTLLYPCDFRARYRDDLLQHYADLVEDRGLVAAWLRTALDLVITLPTYRLESTMSTRNTALAMNVIAAALGAVGLAIMAVGFPLGGVLMAIAVVVAITQRTNIALSFRDPGPGRRGRRFAFAAVLAALAVTVLVIALNDDEWGDRGQFIYNVSFLACAVASVSSLVTGLLTPRRPQPNSSALK